MTSSPARTRHLPRAERQDSALGGRESSSGWRRSTERHVRHVPRARAARFLASKVRLSLDYLRYLRPGTRRRRRCACRARSRTPQRILARHCTCLLARRIGCAADDSRRALRSHRPRAAAEPATRALPRRCRPDLVIITPLVGVVASSQLDLLRSAQARGIPTAVCVWSWDHLSSKAIIRDVPDRLFVWNDVQKRRSARHARRAVGARRRDGRAMLRSLVRSAAGARPRRSSRAMSACPTTGHSSCGCARRSFPAARPRPSSSCNGRRPSRSSADARLRDAAILDPPASVAATRMG